jgi:hypothetical protein
MGLEIATVALIGTAVAGTGTLYSVERGMAARREAKRARRMDQAAREVSQAQQENERQAGIRQQMRQERVRRAQVMSAAEQSGLGGSSVKATTIGVGNTLMQAGQAFATGQSMFAATQSALLQQAANYRGAAKLDQSQGQLGSAFAGFGNTMMAAAPSLGTAPPPAQTPVGGTGPAGVDMNFDRFSNYA